MLLYHYPNEFYLLCNSERSFSLKGEPEEKSCTIFFPGHVIGNIIYCPLINEGATMKRIIASLGILLLVAAVHVVAATPFEGKVVYNIEAGSQAQDIDMTMYIKGKKTRVEMDMPGNQQMSDMSMIVDGDAQKMYMIMDQQKMVMAMMTAVPDKMKKNMESAKNMDKPQKTGKSKAILGYDCEQWMMKDKEGNVIEIWSAKGLGNFTGMMGKNPLMGSGLPDMSEVMNAENFFPLHIVMKDSKGKEKFKLEATSVEKKSLDMALFTVPKDYKIMEAPAGMGMD